MPNGRPVNDVYNGRKRDVFIGGVHGSEVIGFPASPLAEIQFAPPLVDLNIRDSSPSIPQ
jgi:hypothetical protein